VVISFFGKEAVFACIDFIMVEPSHPGNVGAAARALKTMGFCNLLLVKPRVANPANNAEAIALASGALDVLKGIEIFDTLPAALAQTTMAFALTARGRELGPPSCDVRQAGVLAYQHLVATRAAQVLEDTLSTTSASGAQAESQGVQTGRHARQVKDGRDVQNDRERRENQEAEPAQQAQRVRDDRDDQGDGEDRTNGQARQLHGGRECQERHGGQGNQEGRVAVVLGTERSGLTNDQIALCQRVCHIPANPQYSSLNVAQALQLVAWEMRYALLAGASDSELPPSPTRPPGPAPAPGTSVQAFLAHWEEALTRVGFLDPAHPKKLMMRMRHLFARAQLSREEVDMMRGVCTAMIATAKGRRHDP